MSAQPKRSYLDTMGAQMAAQSRAAEGLTEKEPCGIAGCKRISYKGYLCRAHYALVPINMAMDAVVAAQMAQRRAAAKEHRKQLGYVQRLVSAPPSPRSL